MDPRTRLTVGVAAVLVSGYVLAGTALTERIPLLGVVVMVLLPAGVVLVTTAVGRALREAVAAS